MFSYPLQTEGRKVSVCLRHEGLLLALGLIPSCLVEAERPEHLHSWGSDAIHLELANGFQSTRATAVILATQEVEVETAAQGSVRDVAVSKQPFLTVCYSCLAQA